MQLYGYEFDVEEILQRKLNVWPVDPDDVKPERPFLLHHIRCSVYCKVGTWVVIEIQLVLQTSKTDNKENNKKRHSRFHACFLVTSCSMNCSQCTVAAGWADHLLGELQHESTDRSCGLTDQAGRETRLQDLGGCCMQLAAQLWN